MGGVVFVGLGAIKVLCEFDKMVYLLLSTPLLRILFIVSILAQSSAVKIKALSMRVH